MATLMTAPLSSTASPSASLAPPTSSVAAGGTTVVVPTSSSSSSISELPRPIAPIKLRKESVSSMEKKYFVDLGAPGAVGAVEAVNGNGDVLAAGSAPSIEKVNDVMMGASSVVSDGNVDGEAQPESGGSSPASIPMNLDEDESSEGSAAGSSVSSPVNRAKEMPPSATTSNPHDTSAHPQTPLSPNTPTTSLHPQAFEYYAKALKLGSTLWSTELFTPWPALSALATTQSYWSSSSFTTLELGTALDDGCMALDSLNYSPPPFFHMPGNNEFDGKDEALDRMVMNYGANTTTLPPTPPPEYARAMTVNSRNSSAHGASMGDGDSLDAALHVHKPPSTTTLSNELGGATPPHSSAEESADDVSPLPPPPPPVSSSATSPRITRRQRQQHILHAEAMAYQNYLLSDVTMRSSKRSTSLRTIQPAIGGPPPPCQIRISKTSSSSPSSVMHNSTNGNKTPSATPRRRGPYKTAKRLSELAAQAAAAAAETGNPDLAINPALLSFRKYKCTFCNKIYKNPNGLRYHEAHSHPGEVIPKQKQERPALIPSERPYVCPVKSCGKQYRNSGGIKYHMRHHHDGMTSINSADDEGDMEPDEYGDA